MNEYSRVQIIADSNGEIIRLPGDTTANPNNAVVAPFYSAPVQCPGDWFMASPESLGVAFVVFRRNSREISAPVLLMPGMVYPIVADEIQIVGVRRAGEMWLLFGRGEKYPSFTRADGRAPYRAMECRILPLTNIKLQPSDANNSNIWCHPLSAPASASPMVLGVSAYTATALALYQVGYTAAHWSALQACVFAVDRATQSVYNVRRITNGAITNPGANGVDVNPWDRLGVIAIPSASNPDPTIAPATQIGLMIEAFGVYSRLPEFGYQGFGSKGELA